MITKAIQEWIHRLGRLRDPLRSETNDQDATWTALARMHARETSADEQHRLAAWCDTDPERDRMRRGVSDIIDVSREVRDVYRRRVAWERLERRIQAAVHRPEVRRLVGAPEPTRSRRWVGPVTVGAAAVLLVAVTIQRFGPPWPRHVRHAPPAMREYSAGRGERLRLDLPDGTSVVLGPASTLRLAKDDFARSRTVRLNGIAHFVVTHDPAHPFVVIGGGIAVQDVGTEFTVRAYPGESSEAVVSRGRVLVKAAAEPAGGGTLLRAGDLGVRISTGLIQVRHGVDVDRYFGWMEGKLSYDGIPAGRIAQDLSRWYNLTVRINDTALADTPIHAYFDVSQSSSRTLSLLAELLGARYVRSGDTTVVIERRQ